MEPEAKSERRTEYWGQADPPSKEYQPLEQDPELVYEVRLDRSTVMARLKAAIVNEDPDVRPRTRMMALGFGRSGFLPDWRKADPSQKPFIGWATGDGEIRLARRCRFRLLGERSFNGSRVQMHTYWPGGSSYSATGPTLPHFHAQLRRTNEGVRIEGSWVRPRLAWLEMLAPFAVLLFLSLWSGGSVGAGWILLLLFIGLPFAASVILFISNLKYMLAPSGLDEIEQFLDELFVHEKLHSERRSEVTTP